MLINVVLTPASLPRKQTSGTGPGALWVLFPPLLHWGPEPGKISFYRVPVGEGGGNGRRRRVPGSPSSGTPRESQANFRVGTVLGL